ncbi:MAG: diguanylate cyclase [Planctomycetota bacterium]
MNDQQSHPGSQDPMILIVDDCPASHRLFQASVSGDAVRIEGATSAQDGMIKAEVFQPDLVLLDLNMPGTDGFEMLKALKNNSNTRDIAVLVVSGKSSPKDKIRVFDLGAVDYVVKPFELSELRARIHVALRTQQLVKMLAQRAQIDGLTGLYNRSYFDQRWQEEHQRASRSGQPLSLAFVDLDRFKDINDSYGHSAGDEVLIGIASMIQRTLRVGDVPCRFGGEEFVVILPDTTPNHAALLCDRIRTQCESMVWSRHAERPVTLSVGVTGTGSPAAHMARDWIDQADRNLYSAKSEGRNRVKTTDLGPGALRTAS